MTESLRPGCARLSSMWSCTDEAMAEPTLARGVLGFRIRTAKRNNMQMSRIYRARHPATSPETTNPHTFGQNNKERSPGTGFIHEARNGLAKAGQRVPVRTDSET